jgi:hypothetical protein
MMKFIKKHDLAIILTLAEFVGLPMDIIQLHKIFLSDIIIILVLACYWFLTVKDKINSIK